MGINLTTDREPVCWANVAESTRTRVAFVWKDGQRVAHTDEHGRPITERVPQGAQYGTPIGGLQPAPVRSHVKVLRPEGWLADIRVSQGAAHDPVALGDRSYESYMLDHKGRGEGWIQMGQCPAALAISTDSLGRAMLPVDKIVARDVVLGKEGVPAVPCLPHTVGVRNPPCKHFIAEQEARLKINKAFRPKLEAAFKSDEAKLAEVQNQALTHAMGRMTEVADNMAAVLAEMRPNQKKKGDAKKEGDE